MHTYSIGIDIDGVVCDLVKDVLFIVKRKYNLSLRKKDIYKYEMHDIIGISGKSFFQNIFKEALNHINHPTIKDATKYVNKLKTEHRLHFVTARPETFNAQTKQWLDFNNFKYDKLINIKDNKHKVLSDFDFFIDDNLSEIISASQIKGLKLFLFDQPWNRSYNADNLFTRVKNWEEIYKHVKSY